MKQLMHRGVWFGRRNIVIYVIPKAFKHNAVHINDYFRHCKYGYYFFARRIPITYPLSGLKRYLCKQQAKQRQNSSKATGRERKVGREGEREKESFVVQSIYIQVGTNKSATWTF